MIPSAWVYEYTLEGEEPGKCIAIARTKNEADTAIITFLAHYYETDVCWEDIVQIAEYSMALPLGQTLATFI